MEFCRLIFCSLLGSFLFYTDVLTNSFPAPWFSIAFFLISLLCVAVCSLAVIAVSNGKTDWNIGLMSTATLLGVIKKFHQPKGTKQASFKAVSSWSTSSIPGFFFYHIWIALWKSLSDICSLTMDLKLALRANINFFNKLTQHSCQRSLLVVKAVSLALTQRPKSSLQCPSLKKESSSGQEYQECVCCFVFVFLNNHNEFIPCGQAVCVKRHYKVLQCLSESIWLKLPACHLAPGYNTI